MMTGCQATNARPTTMLEHKRDIQFFVRTATRIAISELDPSNADLEMIQLYVESARALLEQEGPNFARLRELVLATIPEEHQVLVLTIVDVVERYVITAIPEPHVEVKAAIELINAGLDGALEALSEVLKPKEE
jgi:hypothetical protein